METASQLDLQKPLFLVRGEVPRYCGDIEHSIVSAEGDYLTNDPRCLDGLFEFKEEDWEGDEDVVDQQTYDDWLNEIHVSQATGEIQEDRFSNHWYNNDGVWYLIDEDTGLLSFQCGIDGPDDLEEWEMGNYSTFAAWKRAAHPSWRFDPEFQEIITAYKHAGVFVRRGTAELLTSQDWTMPNPECHVDLTPRVREITTTRPGRQDARRDEKMNARDYIDAGHYIETEGWIITLDDTECQECPVAVHKDTHQVMMLCYNEDWREDKPRLDDDMAHYSQDWPSSTLDDHWGNPAQLIADLQTLHDRGLLRVKGAIHGLPGADPLGAIIC